MAIIKYATANESIIKLFEGKQVRIVWDEEQDKLLKYLKKQHVQYK